MNPYDVLGVPPDADDAAIRAAHRKKAMATHPDCGGDPEAFDALCQAVAVLRDPARRARYDATGETDEVRDNSFDQAANALAMAFQRVVQEAMQRREAAEHVDIAERIRKLLRTDLADIAKQRGQCAEEKAAIEQTRKRFTFKGEGPDIISGLFDQQIGMVNQRSASLDQSEAAYKRALAMAEHYDCSTEAVKPQAYSEWRVMNWGNSTT